MYSDYDDRTALHIASTIGNDDQTKTVEILLANGADVHAKDIDGDTPLDNARQGNHKPIIALLMAHIAKLEKEKKEQEEKEAKEKLELQKKQRKQNIFKLN